MTQLKQIKAENGILFVDSNGIPKYGFRLKEAHDPIFKDAKSGNHKRNPDFFEMTQKQYNG